jgi:adenine-specific DNA-methyltransferase
MLSILDEAATAAPTLPSPREIAIRKRLLGAYFTPDVLTKVICEWAIQSPNERVLEPSFGGCGFLEAAAQRLNTLGATSPGANLYGCDIDPAAFQFLEDRLGEKAGNNFLLSDFLAIREPDSWPDSFDVIVGNPPYISYHNLTAEQRVVAAGVVADTESAINLGKHASLWAYFLLHSIRYVKKGGRLALILPRSFLDASYGLGLRDYVASYFDRSIVFVMEQQLFMGEGTKERTVCLLADRKRESPVANQMMIGSACSVADLAELVDNWVKEKSKEVPIPQRSMLALMRSEAKNDFDILNKDVTCKRFGEFCTIKIGIVTGANPFFLFSKSLAKENGLSHYHFKPIVSKFSDLCSLKYTNASHDQNKIAGALCMLFCPSEKESKKDAVKDYLNSFSFEKRIANQTFKKREYWYRPGDDAIPDAFLSCMHDYGPRMCLNYSGANCTNTIYRGYFKEGVSQVKKRILAISLLSSFSQLSAEIEGRSYGSGVSKHEPGEFSNIQVLLPQKTDLETEIVFNKISNLILNGKNEEARQLADAFVFPEKLYRHAPRINAQLNGELERIRALRRRPSRLA